MEEIEEEEEDNESIDSGVIPPPKEGCFEIIGTLKDRTKARPECVKEIINVSQNVWPKTVEN